MSDDTVLRILRDDGQLYDDAAARVVATMLYPKDETRREQLVAYSAERALLDNGIRIPLDITAKTHFGPSKNEFERESARTLNAGAISGQLLLLIKQLVVHQPSDASVRKAADLLAKSLNKYQLDGIAVPASEGSIRTAWRNFKSVCHLWAAWRILEYEDSLMMNERLPELLAVSEWMREFAESHYPPAKPAKSEPLAAKGELWKVPDLMNLPPIEFDTPPLSDQELEWLGDYKAEKHKPS
ncbi:MAG: hypothetical protein OEU46_05405 [Alphaproteobacteria bacterium]|nr:hypothetical protein [Alphaproteobacteria bacterium]